MAAGCPVGDKIITCRGVCTVQMTGDLIYRNEVYFDTLQLIAAIRDRNERKIGSARGS